MVGQTDGRSFSWDDLTEVTIVTTDDGPFLENVFWVLTCADGAVYELPGALVADDLLSRFQALPDFDNEALIAAMKSTDHAKFPCWSRSAEPSG